MISLLDTEKKLRNNDAVTKGMIPYSAFSAPVPCVDSGRVTERRFIFSSRHEYKKLRPYAWLETDIQSGELIFFHKCSEKDFVDFAASDVSLDYSLPFGELMGKQLALCKLMTQTYNDIRNYVFSENTTAAQKRVIKTYHDAFVYSTPKDLIRYYEALSPDFFEWIKNNES